MTGVTVPVCRCGVYLLPGGVVHTCPHTSTSSDERIK